MTKGESKLVPSMQSKFDWKDNRKQKSLRITPTGPATALTQEKQTITLR